MLQQNTSSRALLRPLLPAFFEAANAKEGSSITLKTGNGVRSRKLHVPMMSKVFLRTFTFNKIDLRKDTANAKRSIHAVQLPLILQINRSFMFSTSSQRCYEGFRVLMATKTKRCKTC
jgi:hypothetical protein